MAFYIQCPVHMDVPWLPSWLFDRKKKALGASWFWVRLAFAWGEWSPASTTRRVR